MYYDALALVSEKGAHGLAKVSMTQASVLEVRTAVYPRTTQICPGQIRMGQFRPAEIGLAQVRSVQTSVTQIRAKETNLTKIGSFQIRPI